MSNENEQDDEVPVKKSKLKLILIIITLLLLLSGGAAAFWWFQLRSPATEGTPSPVATTTTTDGAATSTGAQTGTETTGTTTTNADGTTTTTPAQPKTVINLVKLPTVTVNLADTDPIRYLKIGMDVEVNTTAAVTALNSQIAKVRDAVIIILSGKTYSDLATTAGKLLIKNEISTRLNQILGAPRVVQIYFTEFVVQ